MRNVVTCFFGKGWLQRATIHARTCVEVGCNGSQFDILVKYLNVFLTGEKMDAHALQVVATLLDLNSAIWSLLAMKVE